MTKEKYFGNSEFAECGPEELKVYWQELKFYYENGYIPIGTSLGVMRDKYCTKYKMGVVIMEQDLLKAIAWNSFECMKQEG